MQALEVIRELQKHFPVKRSPMRVRLTVPELNFSSLKDKLDAWNASIVSKDNSGSQLSLVSVFLLLKYIPLPTLTMTPMCGFFFFFFLINYLYLKEQMRMCWFEFVHSSFYLSYILIELMSRSKTKFLEILC